ncbi:MAG: hypothetical protein M1813_004203 [Trichoglossum hirsutum]|jgi:hypothetical protein|nr:MAG: hypothetical protein M1813_004203 [Trichoglossum hirsutum]
MVRAAYDLPLKKKRALGQTAGMSEIKKRELSNRGADLHQDLDLFHDKPSLGAVGQIPADYEVLGWWRKRREESERNKTLETGNAQQSHSERIIVPGRLCNSRPVDQVHMHDECDSLVPESTRGTKAGSMFLTRKGS